MFFEIGQKMTFLGGMEKPTVSIRQSRISIRSSIPLVAYGCYVVRLIASLGIIRVPVGDFRPFLESVFYGSLFAVVVRCTVLSSHLLILCFLSFMAYFFIMFLG